jgi:hypothetical protein
MTWQEEKEGAIFCAIVIVVVAALMGFLSLIGII